MRLGGSLCHPVKQLRIPKQASRQITRKPLLDAEASCPPHVAQPGVGAEDDNKERSHCLQQKLAPVARSLKRTKSCERSRGQKVRLARAAFR